jgi:hypothetical protein
MRIIFSGIDGASNMARQGGRSEEYLPGHPQSVSPVALRNISTPRFLVTVDTEEEFDWGAAFKRDGFGIRHVEAIGRFQTLCEERGIIPNYLVDYPIANDPRSIEIFGEILSRGACEIGAQLHAWVTPPFEEEVCNYNSFACNLPAELERAKLHALFEKIESSFGVKAQIYRAGRYGAGPNTIPVLCELGAKIESSVRSLFDYSHYDGPDYADSPLQPYWLDKGKLFELPVTTVFAGLFGAAGRGLFGRAFQSETARALLARARLLERLALTPEGIPLDRALKAIDIAIDMGLPILNFSFHSPSLQAGHTPYVRTEADLEAFYHWWKTVFDHLSMRGVQPISSQQIIDAAN